MELRKPQMSPASLILSIAIVCVYLHYLLCACGRWCWQRSPSLLKRQTWSSRLSWTNSSATLPPWPLSTTSLLQHLWRDAPVCAELCPRCVCVWCLFLFHYLSFSLGIGSCLNITSMLWSLKAFNDRFPEFEDPFWVSVHNNNTWIFIFVFQC